jgi:hypothetical protein
MASHGVPIVTAIRLGSRLLTHCEVSDGLRSSRRIVHHIIVALAKLPTLRPLSSALPPIGIRPWRRCRCGRPRHGDDRLDDPGELVGQHHRTTLGGLRALSAPSQSHNAPLRFCAALKTEMAHNTRSRLIYRSSCSVIHPNFSLSPVEFLPGRRAKRGGETRPDFTGLRSGARSSVAEAASAPTLGMLAASRLTGP